MVILPACRYFFPLAADGSVFGAGSINPKLKDMVLFNFYQSLLS
jgi:hypothetical protein